MATRKKVIVTLQNGKVASFEGNYQSNEDYDRLQKYSHSVSKFVDAMIEIMDKMEDSLWDRYSYAEKVASIFEDNLNGFDPKEDLHETIKSVTIS